MIKNVIFDIGRVLVTYEPYEYVLSYGYDVQTSKKICNIVFEDKRWIEKDRGTISDKEYLNTLITENPNYTDKIKIVYNNWLTMVKPIKETVDFYMDLKNKGYKIYLLSNFSTSYDKVESENKFLQIADGKIISYRFKTIKPEKKIYELLLSTYNLIPQECVFIDDREENIIAAQDLNINGIVFKDIESTKAQFEQYINKFNK